MQKELLLTTSILLSILTSSCKITKSPEDETVYVSTTPEWKHQLYYGTDKEMPTDGSYLMSINYNTSKKGKKINNLNKLANIFSKHIPSWYTAAMIKNYEENKNCSVYVNEKNYTDFVILWMKEHLLHKDYQPYFRNYISDLGFQDIVLKYAFPGYESSAYTGICVLLSTSNHRFAEQEMIKELKEWRDYYNNP